MQSHNKEMCLGKGLAGPIQTCTYGQDVRSVDQ